MSDDKFKNTGWYEKLAQSQIKTSISFGAFDKFKEAEDRKRKAFSGFNVNDFIAAYTPPKTAFDYLAMPTSKTNLMYDTIVKQATGKSFVNDILGGGHTISVLAKYHKDGLKTNAVDTLIQGIQSSVLQNSNSYQAFLKTSKSVSKNLYPSSAINLLIENNNLFSATNFIENKKLNPFDILSGVTFSNLVKIYENTNEEALDEEIKNFDDELINSPELKIEVESLVQNVNVINARNYKKIEDYLTDWIDKVSVKFNISKQKSYFLAMIIIFLAGASAKELLFHKQSGSITNIVNNTYVQVNKTPTYIIIKPAPVYEKSHHTSRKIGRIKENGEVEIKRMKEGWCLIKGLVTIVVKKDKVKTEKDTLIEGWIHQRYLSNFQ